MWPIVTDEDAPVEVTFNGVDPDADPLTYAVVTPPGAGSLGAITGNKVTFTPPADASGTFDLHLPGDCRRRLRPRRRPSSSRSCRSTTPSSPPVSSPSTPEDTPATLPLAVTDPDGG